MFWGVQIGATDRPTEMDCWSNDSNALTEEVFSRKTFVAIWCAFPYVMMRVRKPPLPVYVCAMPQPQKLVYYPRWMRRKTTRVALRIVILILIDKFIDFLCNNIALLLLYISNLIKGQMSLIIWQAIIGCCKNQFTAFFDEQLKEGQQQKEEGWYCTYKKGLLFWEIVTVLAP